MSNLPVPRPPLVAQTTATATLRHPLTGAASASVRVTVLAYVKAHHDLEGRYLVRFTDGTTRYVSERDMAP